MLIGVVGFIESGKNTVGKYISEEYGFKTDSFAKPLKDCVSIIFGWDRVMIEGDTKESRIFREQVDEYWSGILGDDFTPRKAMQLFGTECIRDVFSPQVWISSLIKRYFDSGKVNTIVTDCRFSNEINGIRDNDGYIIRVKRGENPEWYDYCLDLMEKENWHQIHKNIKKGVFPHISEIDWINSDFDFTIYNNGTINDLYRAVDIVMNIIMDKKNVLEI